MLHHRLRPSWCVRHRATFNRRQFVPTRRPPRPLHPRHPAQFNYLTSSACLILKRSPEMLPMECHLSDPASTTSVDQPIRCKWKSTARRTFLLMTPTRLRRRRSRHSRQAPGALCLAGPRSTSRLLRHKFRRSDDAKHCNCCNAALRLFAQ